MQDSLHAQNAFLRKHLEQLTAPELHPDTAIDVVVTVYEINDRHGTGPLIKRVLAGRRHVFSIRARSDWGFQDFGDWNAVLPQQGLSPSACRQRVENILTGRKIRSVLCVPYEPDELLTAIAIHDSFGVPVCTWIMDDQNIVSRRIGDGLMREALQKSALRLATHPELCRAYEQKYGFPFFNLPAVVPHALLAPFDAALPPLEKRHGAMLGSFWDQTWFDRLASALAGTGARVDWFGNHRSRWVKFPAASLEGAGITAHGVIPGPALAQALRRYSFVIVPVSALDGVEPDQGVARLSLPGRILFAAATAHTPILIVGSEDTCGARFVRHFGIGEVAPYQSVALTTAMDRLADPTIQRQMRANAARMASAVSDRGVAFWLAASIAKGAPADDRFEDLFRGYNQTIST